MILFSFVYVSFVYVSFVYVLCFICVCFYALDVLISPHGAFLSNVIHMRPHTLLVEVTSPYRSKAINKEWSMFSNIAGWSVNLSVYPSVYPSVCLPVYISLLFM